MSTETVQMDDAAMFQAAMSEEPPATETEAPAATTETPAPEPSGQPRDEQGRFAAKTQEPEPAPQQPQQPQSSDPAAAVAAKAEVEAIPSWRLREVSERARQYEQQNAALQRELGEMRALMRQKEPDKPKPDFFENPDAATEHHVRGMLDPQMQAVRQQLQYMGRMLAVQAHGEEMVKAADDAFTRAYEAGTLDPADYHRVTTSPNIFDAAVQWHKKQSTLQKIGGDLDGFLKKRDEELLNDPAFMARVAEKLRSQAPGQRPTNIVHIPPSLSRQTAAAPNTPDNPGDMSDASLFRHAMAP